MRILGLWDLLGFKKPISLVTTYPMEMIIMADIWQWTPFFYIVLLAGLASLPREIIEAAEIDGAARFNVVRYIMMPMLKQVIGVTLIIRITDIFKTFGLPYVMTKGGPGFASEVASLYIFNQALQFLNVTYAATLTIILIAAITIVINVFIRGYRLKF
jgi:multiple sugar transport system permease protein